MDAKVTGDPAAPRTLNRELSEQMEEIVLHAMERDPGKRYQTAAAMKGDLDHPGDGCGFHHLGPISGNNRKGFPITTLIHCSAM